MFIVFLLYVIYILIVLVEQRKKFKNPKIIVLTGTYANDVIVLIYL